MQFVDLKRQYEEYKSEIDEAMQAVIDGTRFINGEEVKLLEAELSEFSGAKHSIGCASGTDALLVPLMAKGVKPGRRDHRSGVHLHRHGDHGGPLGCKAGIRRCGSGKLQYRSG
jgi:hypothetical protein